MADARPSESTIEQRIATLSAGEFQRLVETYARIRFQSVERVVGAGRTAADATVGPWPDAYVVFRDGTQWAIEATHAASGWRSHFRKDLSRFAASGDHFAGLLFVSWENGPSERDVFDELKVDSSVRPTVRLVFRRQLVTELRDPRYAKIWLDPLRLPVSAAPFVPLEHGDGLYGREDALASGGWMPRRSEYSAGEVHRPTIYNAVRERLRTERWALVRGKGAAGKTVLALLLASDLSFDWSAIYYLDFTWTITFSDLLNAVVARGDERVLFITDNAHVAPIYARELFQTWESALSGASLLMLSRVVSAPTRSEQDALSQFEPHAFLLAASAEDLAGIFSRLLCRVSNTVIEPPPQPVIENWLKLFGGDLLAFSFAVAKRRHVLLTGDLTLGAGDAQDYIRENYLAEISPKEEMSLARLAALASVELSADRAILGDIPARMLSQGMILRVTGGDEGQYRFIHAGIGDLVLSALPEYDGATIRRQIAEMSPSLAVRLAGRAQTSGDSSLAKSYLERHVTEQTWVKVALKPSATMQTINLFLQLGLITPASADASLVSNVPAFLSELKQNGGGAIATILAFVERTLPLSYEKIRMMLSSDAEISSWRVAMSRATPLSLLLFLRYARVNHTPLFEAIQRELLAAHRMRLADDLRNSDPSHVVGFLNFARTAMPTLWKILQNALENENDAKRIARGILRRQLSQVTGLLRFSRAYMPMLYVETAKLLNDDSHDAEFLRKILSDGMNQMAPFFAALGELLPERHEHFLNLLTSSSEATATLLERAVSGPALAASYIISFIALSMPELLSELVYRLQSDEMISQLANRLAKSNLEALSAFLNSIHIIDPGVFKRLRHSLLCERLAEIASATAAGWPREIEQLLSLLHDDQIDYRCQLIRAIDAEEFKLKDRHLVVGVSRLVLKAFERCGRVDLSSMLAAPAVQFADPIRWPKQGFHLLALGDTLRYTRHLPQDEIDRFLTRVVTPAWLVAQYDKARDADILSGALFDIWTSLTGPQTRRFATPALSNRLNREINTLVATSNPAGIATLVRTAGMLAVYRIAPPSVRFNASLLPVLNEAIRESTLPEAGDYIHFREALFWIGFRSMLCSGRISGELHADEQLLEKAEKFWRQGHPDRSAKLTAIYTEMQSWFNACRKAGWRLLPTKIVLSS